MAEKFWAPGWGQWRVIVPRPVKDKRDECGCHKGCVVTPHECEKPCVWPDCLTDAEKAELREELKEEGF